MDRNLNSLLLILKRFSLGCEDCPAEQEPAANWCREPPAILRDLQGGGGEVRQQGAGRTPATHPITTSQRSVITAACNGRRQQANVNSCFGPFANRQQ